MSTIRHNIIAGILTAGLLLSLIITTALAKPGSNVGDNNPSGLYLGELTAEADLTALPYNTLTDAYQYMIDGCLYVWDASATQGDLQPDDIATAPGAGTSLTVTDGLTILSHDGANVTNSSPFGESIEFWAGPAFSSPQLATINFNGNESKTAAQLATEIDASLGTTGTVVDLSSPDPHTYTFTIPGVTVGGITFTFFLTTGDIITPLPSTGYWIKNCPSTTGGGIPDGYIEAPLYEYRDIWAEEGGATNANNAEWSFGNGATGYMGLPIDEGWEVCAMYFHADTYAATATIQVDLMSYGGVASNAAANTITSISLSSSTDGAGTTNNAWKFVDMTGAPVPVPTSTTLGYITRAETGSISDARVGNRLRREIGTILLKQ